MMTVEEKFRGLQNAPRAARPNSQRQQAPFQAPNSRITTGCTRYKRRKTLQTKEC